MRTLNFAVGQGNASCSNKQEGEGGSASGGGGASKAREIDVQTSTVGRVYELERGEGRAELGAVFVEHHGVGAEVDEVRHRGVENEGKECGDGGSEVWSGLRGDDGVLDDGVRGPDRWAAGCENPGPCEEGDGRECEAEILPSRQGPGGPPDDMDDLLVVGGVGGEVLPDAQGGGDDMEEKFGVEHVGNGDDKECAIGEGDVGDGEETKVAARWPVGEEAAG